MIITNNTDFDTYVTENNPKFYQSKLKKPKSHTKYFKRINPNSVLYAESMAKFRYLNILFLILMLVLMLMIIVLILTKEILCLLST